MTTLSAEDYHSLANEHRARIWLAVAAITESRCLISAARLLLERSRDRRTLRRYHGDATAIARHGPPSVLAVSP